MTPKVIEFLRNWLLNYLKSKDVFTKKIKNIEIDDRIVRVTQKDKSVIYYVLGFEHDIDNLLNKFDKTKHYGLILFNTENNFKYLISNWKKLIEFKQFVIYFVNPFSKLEKRWIIFPYTHNSIADSENLEGGLRSMYETVEQISEKEVLSVID